MSFFYKDSLKTAIFKNDILMSPINVIFNDDDIPFRIKEIYGGSNKEMQPRFQELAVPLFSLSVKKNDEYFESSNEACYLSDDIFDNMMHMVSGKKSCRRMTKSNRQTNNTSKRKY